MKKPPPDPKACASCDSFRVASPADTTGYCYLMPPVSKVQIGADLVDTREQVKYRLNDIARFKIQCTLLG
jgi:hypothetical protein